MLAIKLKRIGKNTNRLSGWLFPKNAQRLLAVMSKILVGLTQKVKNLK